MPELSPQTKKLIQAYQNWHQSLQLKEGVATIHVDEVASAMAAFYEKIREVVDWREDHLMRRAAIERILKRRLLLIKGEDQIAEPLVLELIRGGHFPNNKLPEGKIKDVQKTITKYTFLLDGLLPQLNNGKRIRWYNWFLAIAACEIEEALSPPYREKALAEYMTELMAEKIKIREGLIKIGGISEEEKNTQIYIAVQRSLLNADPAFISYNLLKKRFPSWRDLVKGEKLDEIGKNIYSIWQSIEKELNHPLSEKLYHVCEIYDTPHAIMGDIISKDPSAAYKTIEDPEILEAEATKAYRKRLESSKSKVKRAAIYATLSIFLTKMLLAVAIERQLDAALNQFDYVSFGLNILIPPLLMFLLILTIRPPKKENQQQVLMEVSKIAYKRERQDIYTIDVPKKGAWYNIINFFYLLTFFATFGGIIYLLNKLNFSIASIIIFLIFVPLIAFAGVKIRERAKELEVIERRESFPLNFIMFIVDLFSLPIIRVGKWMSSQWARYNVITIFINFLIDLPFQGFIEFLEQWRNFLKEKKEKIH